MQIRTTEVLTELRAALADRYTVEREIGRGGTATVFLAQDRKHDRSVAIKVLRPELDIPRERFLREIRVAARLRHAHILPLHDSGEAGGFLYYVMPYVEGESLAERLRREKRLDVAEALRITGEVADALDYAHRHGIVHRDIKPGNILIEDEHATVTDFGIARAMDQVTADNLTQTGAAIGTPAYMSPEQLSSVEEIDARSDIYSLACVVYEMLVGEPPFAAPSILASLARRLGSESSSLEALSTVGAQSLQPALSRALAADAAQRHSTAGEFHVALTSAASSESTGISRTTRAAAGPSIAVLPFANMSADPEAEYFADGMSEEIINALTRLESLRVASRTSSFAFKGKDDDVRRIGRQLNVESVLEGSVRKSGPKLRITAQLISIADGYHLWSDRFDRDMTDVFAVQDEIAQAIVSTLKVKLGADAGKTLVKPHTSNMIAYDLYLKGLHFWTRRGEGLQRAMEYFKQAIAADPNYALAYASLAETYNLLAWYGAMAARVGFPLAQEAASTALELDDSLAEAHAALGFSIMFYDWDARRAEQTILHAIELNPGYPSSHHWYSELLCATGRFDRALEEAERAHDLDPLGLIINTLLAFSKYYARRFDEAIREAQRTIELDPTFAPIHLWLAHGYIARGRYTEALEALRTQKALPGAHALTDGLLAFTHARANDTSTTLSMLDVLASAAHPPEIRAYNLALAHYGLRDMDAAMSQLALALEERAPFMILLNVDPIWDEARSEAKFNSIVQRVGFRA